MIFYFTGTGNSRFVAKLLAKLLDDTLVDASEWLRSGKQKKLSSEMPWIFVSPTYAWQLPHIFADLIRKTSFGGSRQAYFVMTCGSDIGNASAYNEALCKEKGFQYQGTLEVVMPENYIAMFQVPEEAEAKEIVRAAIPVIKQGSAQIKKQQKFPKKKISAGDRLKSGIVNCCFYPLCVKDRAFYFTADCISCGKCAADCFMHNIHMENGHPVWGGNCTHCMACICDCPQRAIEYGKKSIGQPRYHCPDICLEKTDPEHKDVSSNHI